MNSHRAIRDIVSRWRGAVLFEIMLAVALFGGAAAFTLAAVRSALATLDQTQRQQEAVDLARSKLAELDAGIITEFDVHGNWVDGWLLELQTRRTEFTGLSLIELTVREHPDPAGPPPSDAVSYTLRQLMELRATGAQSYQEDELSE